MNGLVELASRTLPFHPVADCFPLLQGATRYQMDDPGDYNIYIGD
jgi:hypothetical protein